jgi:DUF1680 family protein
MRRCIWLQIFYRRWTACVIAVSVFGVAARADQPPTKGLQEVPHDRVHLRGGFWGQRQKTHHEVTIPHSLNCLEADGHVTNFDLAAGKFDGPLRGHHAFDSDLYKALEGALYCLQHRDDSQLRRRVDDIVNRIVAAQQKDGFLISYYIVRDSDKRWDNLRLEHQLYNAGHLFEMAIEHHRLTGEAKVLDAARRFADQIDGIFGPGKRYDVGGHEEVELALIKLYRATGDRRYLELSRFFLDERGHAHGTERGTFDPSTAPAELPTFDHLPAAERNRARRRARNSVRNGRMQDHKPLVEQDEAIGHAVRAGYLYSAMADIARFMDAPQYEQALDRIWHDVVFRKMYITGSLGTAQYHDEGFGDPYLLPNRTYCESCANIAHVFWQHRMNLLKGDAKYADVMELALYNGAISGISIAGDQFFYQNPLTSNGSQRSSWIGLSCCPTNLARIIPQLGGFAYARQKEKVYVNLYLAGEAMIQLDEVTTVKLRQTTDYPWDGRVRLTVYPPRATDLYRFADAEASSVTLKINGQPFDATPQADGYVHITRSWQRSDTVELDLPMPIRRVYAHEKVEVDRGKVALMRGPIVYCLEAVDHRELDVARLVLPRNALLHAEHHSDLLGGLTVLLGSARTDGKQPVALTAVPYYAWCNREKGPMTVWINEGVSSRGE